jgi:glycosyltransferase involved in cell wall biosynthesis
MKKLVSIIIPYYNRADYFVRTLQSVVQQTYRPLEILLVDNASTDASPKIAQTFQEKHQEENLRVILLSRDKQGAAAARNKGLQEAHGDYIYFFDSDDEMSASFISDAITLAETANYDVVAAVTRMVNQKNQHIARKYVYTKNPCDQILTGMLSTQAMFFNSNFIRHIGGWSENLLFWNDWELGIRVLLASPKMIWMKKRMYHYIYQHPESITGNSLSESFPKIIDAFKQAEKDISLAAPKSKKKCFRALLLREHIIAGHLYREGHPQQARECLQIAQQIPACTIVRIAAYLLCFLTHHGMRGAWRLARILC